MPRLPLPALCAFLVALFAWSFERGQEWDRILHPPSSSLSMASRGQPVGGVRVYEGAYQSIRPAAGGFDLRYGFVNFNQDALNVRFSIDRQSIFTSVGEFGYYQADLDRLLTNYRSNAEAAARQGASQAQLDAMEQDYKRQRVQYLASKGFRLVDEHKVEIDMRTLVRRNAPRLRAVAKDFEQIAFQKQYDSEDVIGAVISMLQTSLFYKEPPSAEGGRHIGGLLPPLEALSRGWADCDTKTGTAASILTNWDKIKAIGVALPEHYLMGIYQNPRHGDVYVDYQGLPYVLVEPVGPAHLPIGTIGRESMDALQSSQGFGIDVFS